MWDSLTATLAPTHPWATTKWVGENHMANINYPFICTLRLKMNIILTCQEIKHYQILTKKHHVCQQWIVKKSNIIKFGQEIKHHSYLSRNQTSSESKSLIASSELTCLRHFIFQICIATQFDTLLRVWLLSEEMTTKQVSSSLDLATVKNQT